MSIPHLAEDGGGQYLVVDDKPFFAVGGEFHNSSGSDPSWMDRMVWPAVRDLGATFFLTGAYWDLIEPEEGVYDFSLIDAVIDQARREGVHIGFLWFASWKNGTSDYLPQWLKADRSRFTIVVDENGKPVYVPHRFPFYTISPLSEEVMKLDARAFGKLMAHIKEYDSEQTTVIMMQVENEIGIWGGLVTRDYSEPATAFFNSEVPAEVAAHYNVSGTWPEAFGAGAGHQMMAYCYAKYVEQVTQAGKKEYPIPMYVNAVVGTGPFLPVGGPDGKALEMWKLMAPTVDWISPDLYSPEFKQISADYIKYGNSFFLPETTCGRNTAGNFIYALGGRNCFGFNPFAIERMFFSDEDYKPGPNTNQGGRILPERHHEGRDIKMAYAYGRALWPEIRKAYAEGRVKAFLQEDSDPQPVRAPGDIIEMQDYRFEIYYGFLGADPYNSNAGGLIIERGKNEFLLFAVNCMIEYKPRLDLPGDVFMTDKYEWRVVDGELVKGRCLNGDERGSLGGPNFPWVVSFKLDYIP